MYKSKLKKNFNQFFTKTKIQKSSKILNILFFKVNKSKKAHKNILKNNKKTYFQI